MPRLMSVAFTEQAVRDQTKTVTRRKGWTFLKPGDQLTLCRKVMGRKGAPLVRVAEVLVIAVTREPLSAITPQEVSREGFPGMEPAEFIRRFFTDAQGISADAEVTRIEWRYLSERPRCDAICDGDGGRSSCFTPWCRCTVCHRGPNQ